ncbi:MAG: response regulator [Bacteroidales bacterium]
MGTRNSGCINIAIADDHEIFRLGMKHLLNEIPFVNLLIEASNGKDLLMKLEKSLPDIIFMDINMPILNGIDTTKIIKEKYPSIKIIALTAQKDIQRFKQMIKLGVNGFIHKSASASEIRASIFRIMNGASFISSDLFDTISKIVMGKEEENSIFSKRELEILELIYHGLETKEIANKLCLSQRTVEKHKSNMMSKTKTRNTVQLIIYAIKNNLK